jgi:hypothetical protein
MIAFAFERIADNLPMPGVLVMRRRLPVGSAIQELLIVIECSEQQEMDGRVEFVPANPIVKE